MTKGLQTMLEACGKISSELEERDDGADSGPEVGRV